MPSMRNQSRDALHGILGYLFSLGFAVSFLALGFMPRRGLTRRRARDQ